MMKRRVMTYGILSGFYVFMILCNSKNIFGSSVCDTSIYQSVKAEDIYDLHVAGINLEEYGYIRVYQYVLVNTETLFVLGYTKSEKPVLSTISLDSHKSTVIMEYPWALAGFLAKATLMIFFPHDFQSSISFVLIEYLDGNIAKEAEETVTYLDIFRVDSIRSTLLQRETIAETNVIFNPNSTPELKYRYVYSTGDDPAKGYEPIIPAHHESAKVLFCDFNNDDYPDILVWKQRYISRLIEDKGNEDFVLEKEELSAMYFEPKNMTFSPLTPLNLGQIKNINELPFWREP